MPWSEDSTLFSVTPETCDVLAIRHLFIFSLNISLNCRVQNCLIWKSQLVDISVELNASATQICKMISPISLGSCRWRDERSLSNGPAMLFPLWCTFVMYISLCAVLALSHLVMSNSLRPHELQHARLPCPSPTPRAYSNSCPSSWWCYPTI